MSSSETVDNDSAVSKEAVMAFPKELNRKVQVICEGESTIEVVTVALNVIANAVGSQSDVLVREKLIEFVEGYVGNLKSGEFIQEIKSNG